MTIALEDHPAEPSPLLTEWMDTGREEGGLRNWNSAVLASVDADSRPSARVVLIKNVEYPSCDMTFFTNYQSRKGREIEAHPHVALSLHWDALERQIRVEGVARRAPDAVSDEYFASRPRDSQVGAWASEQSAPLDGWETLLSRVFEVGMQYGDGPVPRPPHWGGYVVSPTAIEFWQGGMGRVHQRVRYVREDTAWTVGWLFP